MRGVFSEWLQRGKAITIPINYRPVKIFERIIQITLNFSSENNTLKERQHGFRTFKGTSTAITIAYALAQKKQVYMVLRDVAKAFDEVWHNGLKYQLRLQLSSILNKILCHFWTIEKEE